MPFLSVFIVHDAAHKCCEKILCSFRCWWKGEVWENMSFLRNSSSNYFIIREVVPPPSTSIFLTKYGTEIFIFFPIIRISCVPIFFKSFAFETFWHKNVIVLADVFPKSCQWSDNSV